MSDTVIVIQSVAETVQTVQTEAVVGESPVPVVVEGDATGTIYGPEAPPPEVIATQETEAIQNTSIETVILAAITEGPQGAQGATGPQGPAGELPIIANPNDGEVHLTPKASSSGAEGTMFYNDADDHVYVATE